MKERCENCKGLEEEIYWKHFQSMQFCQFLTGDFHSQLMIPGKFSEKLREKLTQKLGLRGPSGTIWDVKLVESGDVLYFGGGWEEFVDAHSLAEKDILVFKYTGNSQFDVLMFEGSNLCEKESSYFVRKCGHTKKPEDEEITTPRTLKECSMEIIQEHSPKDLVSTPVENSGKGTVVADCETADAFLKRSSHFNDKEKGMKRASYDEPEIGCAEDELSQIPSQIWEPVKLPGSKQMPMKEGKSTTYHLCYASNRRPVTEAEKVAALKSASKELSEGSFLVAMRSTHVNKRFYLNLPSEWAMMHVVHERQDVILRTKERSWKTTLIFNATGRGGLSRGWRDFALDNSLEESDVCVFKLTSQKQKPVVLDVSIFRVVPEVAPPTRLTLEPSSSQGASSVTKRKFTEMGNDAHDN